MIIGYNLPWCGLISSWYFNKKIKREEMLLKPWKQCACFHGCLKAGALRLWLIIAVQMGHGCHYFWSYDCAHPACFLSLPAQITMEPQCFRGGTPQNFHLNLAIEHGHKSFHFGDEQIMHKASLITSVPPFPKPSELYVLVFYLISKANEKVLKVDPTHQSAIVSHATFHSGMLILSAIHSDSAAKCHRHYKGSNEWLLSPLTDSLWPLVICTNDPFNSNLVALQLCLFTSGGWWGCKGFAHTSNLLCDIWLFYAFLFYVFEGWKSKWASEAKRKQWSLLSHPSGLLQMLLQSYQMVNNISRWWVFRVGGFDLEVAATETRLSPC